VNAARVGNSYKDGSVMGPLVESPGLRIINPTKAGDGYWNYEKMAVQTEDTMHALGVLEPTYQQIHQFDWSSGHKKGKDDGLDVNNMNFNFGGSGGHQLRGTELSDGCVGDGDAFMYESIVIDARGESESVWSLEKPPPNDKTVVNIHDCRVRSGDIQSMSFAKKGRQSASPV